MALTYRYLVNFEIFNSGWWELVLFLALWKPVSGSFHLLLQFPLMCMLTSTLLDTWRTSEHLGDSVSLALSRSLLPSCFHNRSHSNSENFLFSGTLVCQLQPNCCLGSFQLHLHISHIPCLESHCFIHVRWYFLLLFQEGKSGLCYPSMPGIGSAPHLSFQFTWNLYEC